MIRVSIYLPEELHARIMLEAQKRGMALSAYIRSVLEAALIKSN